MKPFLVGIEQVLMPKKLMTNNSELYNSHIITKKLSTLVQDIFDSR